MSPLEDRSRNAPRRSPRNGPSPRAHLLTALTVLPALAAGGCFSSCDDPAPAGRAQPPGIASKGPGFGAAPLTDPETQVARGEAIVQVENGRATVLANQYPRLGLLGKLSRKAGFEQQRYRSSGSPSADVTVRVIDATVEEAIAGILGGLDYHLSYESAEGSDRAKLAKVTLGELTQDGRGQERTGKGRHDRDSNLPRSRISSRGELRDREERRSRRDREVEIGLASDDQRQRADAVDRMRPEGDELERLKELLARDPSPAVRSTAAARLESGTEGTVVDALIAALSDPDPGVVLAAIEALEFAAESDHVPAIRQSGVQAHPVPEVRAAYIEMLEFVAD